MILFTNAFLVLYIKLKWLTLSTVSKVSAFYLLTYWTNVLPSSNNSISHERRVIVENFKKRNPGCLQLEYFS